jgi:hypothetical protein
MGTNASSSWNVTVTGDRLDWREIRDRVDVAAVATNLLGPAPGRRGERGRRLWWRCPFHEDKNPSLGIEPGKPWWRCYGCGEHGDAPKLVMKLKGVSFPEAIRVLAELSGIVAAAKAWSRFPTRLGNPDTPTLRQQPQAVSIQPTISKPAKPATSPPERSSGLPSSEASSLVIEAQKRLWAPEGAKALSYLHGRGLSDETIKAVRLGVVNSVSIPTREGDRCYRARGVVIPWFEGDRLVLLKIRQHPGDTPKYVEAYRDRPEVYPSLDVIQPGRPLIIVEGELDCLLLAQELDDLAAVVTLGSASSRPDPSLLGSLLAAAPWYLAHDADEAGDRSASGWPARAIRVRPPGPGKDWTDTAQVGVDLRRWWAVRLSGTEAPSPTRDIEPEPFGGGLPSLDDILAPPPIEPWYCHPDGTVTRDRPDPAPPSVETEIEPVLPHCVAPGLTPEEVDAIDAIRGWPLDDHASLAESIEAGRQWNEAVRRRGEQSMPAALSGDRPREKKCPPEPHSLTQLRFF